MNFFPITFITLSASAPFLQTSLNKGCFYFIFHCCGYFVFFILVNSSQQRRASLLFFPPVEEGLVQFLRLGLGFDSRLRIFFEHFEDIPFIDLDFVRVTDSSRVRFVVVRVAKWWLLYQEQCLGWCALRQARTTPEQASPWKVRNMTTCVWTCAVTKLISAPLCQLVAW